MPVDIRPPYRRLNGFIKALVLAKGDKTEALKITKELGDPDVIDVVKTIIDSMDTTVAFSRPFSVGRELIESTLQGQSVFGALRPFMREAPLRTSLPHETAVPGAAWVSESGAVPVAKLTLAATSPALPFYKLSAIIATTAELGFFGSVGEDGLRRALGRGLARNLDTQFLSPLVAIITDVQPAAVTNLSLTRTSTGSTGTQVLADLTNMVSQLTTWGAPRWVMKPTTGAFLAGLLTAGNVPLFPNVSPLGGTLLGIPNVTSVSSPQQITLLDCDQVLYNIAPLDVQVSTEGSVEMSSSPGQGDESPIVSNEILKSLWQLNLLGLKGTLAVSYLRMQQGSCVNMTVSY
jgi:HK97 family phage major capsid protein